jgi:phosphoglycolate phosphatase-like HAD superfamily hydrolase
MMEEKHPAVIFDMDGTLCDVTSVRHHVLDRRRRNYPAFHYLSIFCPPFEWVRDHSLRYHAENIKVLVVTARREQWRHLTENWLDTHDIPYEAVYMRKQEDPRKDKIIKGEILDGLLESYDILHAFDDNPSIIELWQERGIPHTVVPGWAEEYI